MDLAFAFSWHNIELRNGKKKGKNVINHDSSVREGYSISQAYWSHFPTNIIAIFLEFRISLFRTYVLSWSKSRVQECQLWLNSASNFMSRPGPISNVGRKGPWEKWFLELHLTDNRFFAFFSMSLTTLYIR